MAVEDSILQAGNFLEGAAGVVNKGLSIFDNVASRFNFNPVGIIPSSDPAGETGGQVISQPKVTLPKSNVNAGLLIVGAVAVYLLFGRS
jgi:hypothetical protein